MSKSSRLRGPLDRRHGKRPEHWFNINDSAIITLIDDREGNLKLAVNVLRKDRKNFYVSKSDFSNSITFTVITQAGKSALIKIESVFRTFYHVACREVLSNSSF